MTTPAKARLWLLIPIVLLLAGRVERFSPDSGPVSFATERILDGFFGPMGAEASSSGEDELAGALSTGEDESSGALTYSEARTSARAILPVRYNVPVQEKPAPDERAAEGRAARSLVLSQAHRAPSISLSSTLADPSTRRHFLQVYRC